MNARITRRSMLVLMAAVVQVDAKAGEPAVGMLTVHVIDEAGRPLPARVHLRDAEGRYLFVPGQSTRQKAVYKGTQAVCGDWFYTDGSFSFDVGAGEAQIDIAHGPAYASAHETIAIVAGQNTEKTYTLRRLIDPLARGWYSADEHLHQMPDAALMLAEDLNLAAVPICGGVDLNYRPRQKLTQLTDANHLLVTEHVGVQDHLDASRWQLKWIRRRFGRWQIAVKRQQHQYERQASSRHPLFFHSISSNFSAPRPLIRLP